LSSGDGHVWAVVGTSRIAAWRATKEVIHAEDLRARGPARYARIRQARERSRRSLLTALRGVHRPPLRITQNGEKLCTAFTASQQSSGFVGFSIDIQGQTTNAVWSLFFKAGESAFEDDVWNHFLDDVAADCALRPRPKQGKGQ